MTIIVGITGGIGSGKSTFSKQILKRKLLLLDSDEQVSQLYKKPKKKFIKYLHQIGLGQSIKKNKIDKRVIREIIFKNKAIKAKLEKYIFKIVRAERAGFIKKQKKLKTKAVFFDIPLLFESNLENDFNLIISIISTKKHRFKRLGYLRNISKEMFDNIVKSQTTDVVRKKKSDIVIFNNNSLENYIEKINIVLNKIVL